MSKAGVHGEEAQLRRRLGLIGPDRSLAHKVEPQGIQRSTAAENRKKRRTKPEIGRNGLPGNRVDSIRAGMTPKTLGVCCDAWMEDAEDMICIPPDRLCQPGVAPRFESGVFQYIPSRMPKAVEKLCGIMLPDVSK